MQEQSNNNKMNSKKESNISFFSSRQTQFFSENFEKERGILRKAIITELEKALRENNFEEIHFKLTTQLNKVLQIYELDKSDLEYLLQIFIHYFIENKLIIQYLNNGISNLMLKILNSNKRFPNLVVN